MVTKAEFLFMILILTYHPVHIPSHPVHTAAHCNPLQPAANHLVYIQCTRCSSYYIFSAHCSHVQPCTAICSQLSVHTAANCSHLQPSTLQLFYPVHTAAILSSAHCSSTIQCTLQLYHPVHTAAIPSSAHCSYTFYTVYPVHLWTTTG